MTLVNFACIGKKGWILALAEGKKNVKVCTWASLRGEKMSPLERSKGCRGLERGFGSTWRVRDCFGTSVQCL